jgi:hypothetical protein
MSHQRSRCMPWSCRYARRRPRQLYAPQDSRTTRRGASTSVRGGSVGFDDALDECTIRDHGDLAARLVHRGERGP